MAKRNQTMVKESAKLSATFNYIGRKPQTSAVMAANRIPLFTGNGEIYCFDLRRYT